VIILKFLFTGQEPILSINLAGLRITGYSDGLMDGLKIGSRMAGAISIIVTLGFTTSFTEITTGLSWFRIPGSFIEVLMFAYHYIFLLFEEAMVIYHAQKNRLGYIDIKKGLNSFGLLTGTLVIKSFDHAQNISEAMIQRGYTGKIPVILKNKPLKLGEVVLATLFIFFAGAIWMM
jgi:cobalt/nickel transport system permease protein